LTGIHQAPSFNEEMALVAQGYRYIAGVDEVGRGALAGPVVAAAVILPTNIDVPWLGLVRDSKQLSPARREFLYPHIQAAAVAVGIGSVPPEVVDARGIVKATRLAMQQAIEQLAPPPETLLIDYMYLPEVKLPQKGLIAGDCRCFSIACASIIAKVTRDRLMVELDKTYPGYRLSQNKGYGTREHYIYLHRLGPSAIHRCSFKLARMMLDI